MQPLVLVGLHGYPLYAAAGIVESANRNSYPLNHTPDSVPAGYATGSGNLRPLIQLTVSEYPIRDEDPIGEDENPVETQAAVEPITRILPIGGEKVRAMGYDLPLPFGLGANFVYMDQGIAIDFF